MRGRSAYLQRLILAGVGLSVLSLVFVAAAPFSTKSGDQISTTNATGCDACGVANVGGNIPDRKRIEPVLVPSSGSNVATSGSLQASGKAVQRASGLSSLATTNWNQIPFLGRTSLTPPARNNTASAYDE